ncbi:cysteine desulfurase [Perkinsela sp. CCAP 1560/4]|nr:cysteine desulfurase [Perkinsela sp. CCAP 1560/4]|eukprot:KNH05525.1 cysteine desulfurase [Perkinsela sp. CCAP 1560/4]
MRPTCAKLSMLIGTAGRSDLSLTCAKNTHVGKGRNLYFDMQATSPLDPRVLDAMMPYFTEIYGNAHSRTHSYGWEAEEAVETARKQVASLINVSPKEIFFTSGATESNNIAIKGVAHFYKGTGKNHIITLQTEHKCVLDSCRSLELEGGFDVTYLPVQKNGIVDLAVLRDAMTPKTSLVSVMTVNNEIGVIQPIREIGELCRSKGVFFHTDAAQAVGKIPVNAQEMKCDLMSISGHKFYGPKGVGALYVCRRPRVRVKSPVSGGGQERGIRSGTLATPLIAGLGAACAVAKAELPRDTAYVNGLSTYLWEQLQKRIPKLELNGDATARYWGNVNVSFAGVEGESLLMGLKTVAISSGSACTSASLEPSYVLRALGVSSENAHTSLRFGIGRFTTRAEIDFVVDKCATVVHRLREMSPLWDLIESGVDLSTIQWRR